MVSVPEGCVSRFQPGDVVIHQDRPSVPLTIVQLRSDTDKAYLSDGTVSRFKFLHGTGMRVVSGRPRGEMRYGR